MTTTTTAPAPAHTPAPLPARPRQVTVDHLGMYVEATTGDGRVTLTGHAISVEHRADGGSTLTVVTESHRRLPLFQSATRPVDHPAEYRLTFHPAMPRYSNEPTAADRAAAARSNGWD